MFTGEACNDDEEVFFGEISERELQMANKYARRKTDLYVPSIGIEKSVIENNVKIMEKEEEPMVAGYESMSSPPSLVGFNIMTSPPLKVIPEKSPPAPNNSPMDPEKSPIVDILVNSRICMDYQVNKVQSPKCTMPLNLTVNKEYSPMPRECDSRLWDSGVECGTVDCSVRSTPMSLKACGKKTAVNTELERDTVCVPLKCDKTDLVGSSFDVTREIVNHRAKDSIKDDSGKYRVKESQVQTDLLTKQTRRSLTFSVCSESGMDSENSVQDESKTMSESLNSMKPVTINHTAVSTPRISAVPTLDFSSPHLLVSPIAKYKMIDALKRADTKQSVPSSKLILSSASAFQRVSSQQAIRRSLRKKTVDDNSMNSFSQEMDLSSSSCYTSENDISGFSGSWQKDTSALHKSSSDNRHSIACIEDMVTGFRDTINELTKSISQLNERLTESSASTLSKNYHFSGRNTSCDINESSGRENTFSEKGAVITSPPSKSVSENVLSLPSTLAGQQLLYVKSRELSQMNLDSSPDSVLSHCSTTTHTGLQVSSSDSSGRHHQRNPVNTKTSDITNEVFSRTQSFVTNQTDETKMDTNENMFHKSFHELPCTNQNLLHKSFHGLPGINQNSLHKSFHELPCTNQNSLHKSFHELPGINQREFRTKQESEESLLHEPLHKSLHHLPCSHQKDTKEKSFRELPYRDIPFIDDAPSEPCDKHQVSPVKSVSALDLVNNDPEPSGKVRHRRSKTKRKYVAETSRLSWTETDYFDSDSSSSELSDSYNYSSSSDSDSSSSLLDYSISDSFDRNPSLLVTVDGSKERLSPLETSSIIPSTETGTKGKLVRQRSFQEKLRHFRDKLVPKRKKSSKMKVDKENVPTKSKKKNSYPKTPRPLKNANLPTDMSGLDASVCLKVHMNDGEIDAPDVTQYKKKAPQRWRKPDGFTSLSPVGGKKSKCDEHVERITQLHTMCNGQRIVRYLNFSESPMIIKHYPPPKEASKVSWSDTVIEDDAVFSPVSSPPPPKPILQQKPNNHLYPFVGDVPSPIILTRTRRSKTLFRKVTQL